MLLRHLKSMKRFEVRDRPSAISFLVKPVGRAMLPLSRLIPSMGNVLNVERRIGVPIDIAARWELRPPE